MTAILKKRSLLTVIMGLTFLCVLALPYPGKSDSEMYFDNINISVNINKDGSLDVIEERTYLFTSETDFAEYYLPGPADAANISEFTLVEESFLYQPADLDIRAWGTYTRDNSLITFYFNPSTTYKTFTFSYHVSDATVRYQDTAELSWQLISDEWPLAARDIKITFNIPEISADDQLHAWIHGPLSQQINIINGNTISASVDYLKSSTSLDCRVLFPTAHILGELNAAAVKDEIFAQESQLEQQRADELKQQAEHEKNLLWGALIYLCIFQPVVLLLWIAAYKTAYKQSDLRGDFPPQLPILTPPTKRIPATLTLILSDNKIIDSQAMVATLLDLARRGQIKIEEEKKFRSNLSGSQIKYNANLRLVSSEREQTGTLLQFEKDLLTFIFPESSDNPKISISALEKLVDKKSIKLKKFKELWHQDLLQLDPGTHFVKDKRLSIATRFWIVSGLLLLLGSPVIILGFFLIPRLQKKSLNPEQEKQLWHRYGSYIKDLPRTDTIPDKVIASWEDILIYGIALHESKAVFQVLPSILQIAAHQPRWYSLAGQSAFSTALIPTFCSNLHLINEIFLTNS